MTCFQGANQINIKRIRLCREGEYEPANYLPVSKKDISVMYQELLSYINSMENEWLKKLMEAFFVKDEAFLTNFKIFRSEKRTSWICRRSAGAHAWRCEAVRLFCKILLDVKKGSAFGCRDVS